MSLPDLATTLRAQASGSTGTVTLDAATITQSNLNPPPNLDAMIAGAFQLPSGTTLQVKTTAAQINDPSGSQLTMTGSLTVLNVPVTTVNITFTLNSLGNNKSQLDFVLVAALPATWKFKDSFIYMDEPPFSTLPITYQTYIFSSSPVASWTWLYDKNQPADTIALQAGMNFASCLLLDDYLAPVLKWIPGLDKGPYSFFGPLDPHLVDNQEVIYPSMNLVATLSDAEFSLAFLKVSNPYVRLEIDTVLEAPPSEAEFDYEVFEDEEFEDEEFEDEGSQAGEYVQTPQVLLGFELTIDNQLSLDFETSVLNHPYYSLGIIPADQQHLPTLPNVFGLMAGQNWYEVLPSELQQFLSDVAFAGFSADFVLGNSPRITGVAAAFTSTTPWSPFEQVTIQQIRVTWAITDPGGDNTMLIVFDATMQFFPHIFDGTFSVEITSDLVISGRFNGSVTFSKLVSGITAGSITLPSTFNSFTFSNFDLYMDVRRSNYAFGATVNASLQVLGNNLITLDAVRFQLGVYAAPGGASKQFTGSINGIFYIGSLGLVIAADYASASGWTFRGATLPGESIDIGSLVDQLLQGMFKSSDLPSDLVPTSLVVRDIVLTAVVPAGETPGSYGLAATVEWKFTVGSLDIDLDAQFEIEYKGGQTPPYSAKVQVATTLGEIGAQVVLSYQLQQGNVLLGVTWEGLTATYNQTTDTITFSSRGWSFGTIITALVRLVDPEAGFALPTPWDLLNKISLDGLSITIDLKNKNVAATYSLVGREIDLGFVTIQQIGFQKDDTGAVNVTLTAKFLGESTYKPMSWDAASGSPPAVPGQGTQAFDLQLLALGQHVGIQGSSSFPNVQAAITALQNFQPPSSPNQVPISGSNNPPTNAPYFLEGSNWLMGAAFTLMNNTILVQAVFNDPNLYGLRISVTGGATFAGLDFEIMYKKINDSIGLYQLDLKLPDAMRNLDFGALSLVLPVVGVQIYTNGNFRIDFGFPANMDFSRSFAVQYFPFAGAGGFYFGVLSGATSARVPQSTLGTFNPVIVFGIGLQIGVARTFNSGILKAGVSITVLGILEGIIAKWNPNPTTLPAPETPTAQSDSQIEGSYYYWVQGTLGIIGKVYATIDFSIIQASLNITVYAYIRATIESCRPLYIYLEAGIQVSLAVKINLGLLKITINLSFSTTIRESFTLGSASTCPWDPSSALLPTARFRFFARDPIESYLAYRDYLDWTPLPTDNKPPLNLYFGLHLTVSGDPSGALASQRAGYVAMLYIDSPSGPGDAGTSFDLLAQETLVWAVTSFSAPENRSTRSAVDSQVLSISQLQAAYTHLTDTGPRPITYDSICSFLSSQFDITIGLQPASQDSQEGASNSEIVGTVFPMIPALTLQVPAYKGAPEVNVDFDNCSCVNDDYIAAMQTYFSALTVQYQNQVQQECAQPNTAALRREEDSSTESLATFIFEDYFLLVARQMVQSAIDSLKNYSYPLRGPESISDILNWANAFQVNGNGNTLTVAEFADANKASAITGNRPLQVSSVTYRVQSTDTLTTITDKYNDLYTKAAGFTRLALVQQNENASGLLQVGVPFTLNGLQQTEPQDTFASLVTRLNTDYATLTSALQDVPNLLTPLYIVSLPTISFTSAPSNQDTLSGLAASYGVTPASLAQDNQGVSSFFYKGTGSSNSVDLPGLEYMDAQDLFLDIQRSQGVQQLSGLVARFLLHGLRPPVNDDITDLCNPAAPNSTSPLYTLTGQQFMLPQLDSTDVGKYMAYLKKDTGLDWVTFVPDSGDQITWQLTQASSDWISAVLDQATDNGLAPVISQFGPLPIMKEDPRRFNFRSVLPIQSPVPVTLTNGTPPDQKSATPTLWQFPSDLLQQLSLPKASGPGFAVKIMAGAEPGQPLPLPRDAGYYSWGTLIDVDIRRLPAGDGSTDLLPNTYELQGTDAVGINLLQNLLAALRQPNFGGIAGLYLLYRPNETGQAQTRAGLQTDGMSNIVAFAVQANLSTETNPPQGTLLTTLLQQPSGLTGIINSPEDFIKLLWECSIVRSGGFNIFYQVIASQTGLPDYLFDQKQSGSLSLLIIYGTTNGVLGNYMNCAVLGDSIDPTSETVLAESIVIGQEHPVQTGDRLSSVAGRYNITPVDLGLQNATKPLNLNSTTLTVSNIYYEVRPNDNLQSISTHFGLTVSQVQAANADRGIDWNDLQVWTLLRIPDITLTLSSTSPLKTLSDIATYYGVTLAGLVWANEDVADLFDSKVTLEISDQITDKVATLPPGHVGFQMKRVNPGEDLDDPMTYLSGQYNLLGYQIADNYDSPFKPSIEVTPVGPADQQDELTRRTGRARPRLAGGTEPWNYELTLPVFPYSKFNPLADTPGLPPAEQNPYSGVGNMVQVHFAWCDMFGNKTVTPFTNPDVQTKPPATLPLNDPPIQVGYTDPLMGLSQWPSIAADYIFQTWQSTPSLVVSLRFDPSRYAQNSLEPSESCEGMPAWQKNALSDRQVYAQLYYQVNQTYQDGTPDFTFNLQTTLDQQILHPIIGDQLQTLKTFINSIYKYLDGLLTGKSVPAPTCIVISQPISATNDLDIFELSATFLLQRDVERIHDDFKDSPAVVRAATMLKPRMRELTPGDCTEDPSTQLTLEYFATQFEAAYREDDAALKVATGASNDSLSEDQAGRLWIVRMGVNSSSSIFYQIDPTALFFAPAPLCNSLVSQPNVVIPSFDPQKGLDWNSSVLTTFNNIDLDVWAQQTLAAIDALLLPESATKVFMLDTLANRTGQDAYLTKILDAKFRLAGTIAGGISSVLTTPTANPDNFADASEKLRQQLLIRLSNAYDIDVIVQYGVSVTSKYPSYDQDQQHMTPRLYGQPSVVPTNLGGDGLPMGGTPVSLAYSFSNGKIPLNNGASYLSLAFAAKNAREQKDFQFDLNFQVTNIEHQIEPVVGIEGYMASSWLTFVLPLPSVTVGPVDIPVLLRAYPAPPSLLSQTGTHAGANGSSSSSLESAKLWNYEYTYSQVHAAQDTIISLVQFNVADSQQLFAADAGVDLITALAQFISVYPQLQEVFQDDLSRVTPVLDPSSNTFKAADNAVAAFTELVAQLPGAWAAWLQRTTMLARFQPDAVEFDFSISEEPYEVSGEEVLCVTITPLNSLPPGVALPQLLFEGYTPEPGPSANSFLYKAASGDYYPWNLALNTPARTVSFSALDIMSYQNAWSAVQIIRNQYLVANNPTADNFVYKTPQVRYTSKLTPLLNIYDTITVETISPPTSKTLTDHLVALFSALFQNGTAAETSIQSGTQQATIKLEVLYSYALDNNPALPQVTLPVLLATPFTFTAPDDYTVPAGGCPETYAGDMPFVCKLASAMQNWFSTQQPQTNGAVFTFDISVFSSLTDTKLPLIRLRNVVLDVQYIRNL
ncbi:MAG TPA: LysM peptidoglycan-binding domain-containing protein [Chloroflexia bacterium]|jgi:LysM repeat protein